MDYESLGFKCGLEVHKQLEGRKLFCNCPAINSDRKADINLRRRLRAAAGETGEIDRAAEYEMGKDKEFIYLASSEDVCNVELDEEPPHSINQDALDTVLQVSLLLNARLIDEIQVMRKIVIDGSNTSGFQRTALVAVNGYVDTSLGKVNVATICLEEEAAQKIKNDNLSTTYRLDRLGIPLIEIGTDTDIKNAEHAKETAAKIGMILNSTARVLRGIGSIRQDVNISIKGGARTEIKGFQDLRSITKVIENEINRQIDLIKSGEKLKEEVRKSEPDFKTSFLRPMPGAARMYPETDIPPIRITKERLNKIIIPELVSDRINKLAKKYDLSEDLSRELIDNALFYSFVDKFNNLEPKLIAHILVNTPKEIKSRFKLDTGRLKERDYNEIFDYLNKGVIGKEAVIDLLIDMINGKKVDTSRFKAVSDNELENEIKEIIDENKGLSISAYMGLIMAKYRGKVNGKKVMEIVNRFLIK